MMPLERATEAMFEFLDTHNKMYRHLIEPAVMQTALIAALVWLVRDEEAMEIIVKTVVTEAHDDIDVVDLGEAVLFALAGKKRDT